MPFLARATGLFLAAIVLGAAPPPAAAQPQLIVSPAWLADHLRDPDLVLLHVGDAAGYATGHIPGARLVGLYDLSLRTNDGLRLEMMPAAELHAKLVALGVSDDSRVVLYYDTLGGVTQTTRLMFTLDRAGLGDRPSGAAVRRIVRGLVAAPRRAGGDDQEVTPTSSPALPSACRA